MTQIRQCGRTVAGGIVAFDIQWDAGLEQGDVAWAAQVTSPEGEVLSLVLRRNGDTVQYVEGARGRQDVDVDADIRDDDVIVRFPADVVGAAAEWPAWVGVIALDGVEVTREEMPLRG